MDDPRFAVLGRDRLHGPARAGRGASRRRAAAARRAPPRGARGARAAGRRAPRRGRVRAGRRVRRLRRGASRAPARSCASVRRRSRRRIGCRGGLPRLERRAGLGAAPVRALPRGRDRGPAVLRVRLRPGRRRRRLAAEELEPLDEIVVAYSALGRRDEPRHPEDGRRDHGPAGGRLARGQARGVPARCDDADGGVPVRRPRGRPSSAAPSRSPCRATPTSAPCARTCGSRSRR